MQRPRSSEARRTAVFNRELSWLAFNRRVLEEACNPAHPLLERLRFLSISGNNLDEFFMVRVAGLKGQQLAGRRGSRRRRPDPGAAARRDRRRGRRADRAQQAVWIAAPRGAARQRASQCSATSEIDAPRRPNGSSDHFRDQILPVLTPQAIDPAHPFPFIPNKGFALIFDLDSGPDGEPVRRTADDPADPAALRAPAGRGGALHRHRERRSGAISTCCSPASS